MIEVLLALAFVAALGMVVAVCHDTEAEALNERKKGAR